MRFKALDCRALGNDWIFQNGYVTFSPATD